MDFSKNDLVLHIYFSIKLNADDNFQTQPIF